jgi:hypothetical protein
VLDCSIYDTLFDAAPAGLVDLKIIHETAAIRVLALRWADGEE